MDLGDRVELRQLRPNVQSWQGLRFFASVDAVNRAKGEVILRCDGLRGYEESGLFNVIWQVQGERRDCMSPPAVPLMPRH